MGWNPSDWGEEAKREGDDGNLIGRGQAEIKENQIGQGRKQQATDCENGLTYTVIIFF